LMDYLRFVCLLLPPNFPSTQRGVGESRGDSLVCVCVNGPPLWIHTLTLSTNFVKLFIWSEVGRRGFSTHSAYQCHQQEPVDRVAKILWASHFRPVGEFSAEGSQ
jgi:hypothetical protein